MFKLLAMLGMFLLVALTLLGLRQRRLELTAECSSIYSKVRDRQETLLDQQVEIAKISNPWTLAEALKGAGVNPGAGLQRRTTTLGRGIPAGVETDLVAPVRSR